MGIYRWIYGLFILFFHRPSFAWIGTVPPTFFDPPYLSLANLFLRFPPGWWFELLDVLVALSLVAVTIGLRTRLATLSLLLLWVVGNSFAFSFGKIDHSILGLIVLVAMMFTGWGDTWSVDAFRKGVRSGKERQTDLSLLALFIAFGFFTAGARKALVWLDFDPSTSGLLCWLQGGYFTNDRKALLAPLMLKFDAPWAWEAMDIVAVVFELGFLVVMFFRRYWTLWLIIWCLFHAFNTLVLNIGFNINIPLILAFVPWSVLFSRRMSAAVPASWLPLSLLVLAGVSVLATTRPVSRWLGGPMGMSALEVMLLFTTVAWCCLAVVFLWVYLQRGRLASLAPVGRSAE